MPKSADWRSQRTASLAVPCPFCHAPTGTVCRNTFTGIELDGPPAHPTRLLIADDQTRP